MLGPRGASGGFHDAANADGFKVGEAMDVFYGDELGKAGNGPCGGEEGGLAWVEIGGGLFSWGRVRVGKGFECDGREDGGLGGERGG